MPLAFAQKYLGPLTMALSIAIAASISKATESPLITSLQYGVVALGVLAWMTLARWRNSRGDLGRFQRRTALVAWGTGIVLGSALSHAEFRELDLESQVSFVAITVVFVGGSALIAWIFAARIRARGEKVLPLLSGESEA